MEQSAVTHAELSSGQNTICTLHTVSYYSCRAFFRSKYKLYTSYYQLLLMQSFLQVKIQTVHFSYYSCRAFFRSKYKLYTSYCQLLLMQSFLQVKIQTVHFILSATTHAELSSGQNTNCALHTISCYSCRAFFRSKYKLYTSYYQLLLMQSFLQAKIQTVHFILSAVTHAELSSGQNTNCTLYTISGYSCRAFFRPKYKLYTSYYQLLLMQSFLQAKIQTVHFILSATTHAENLLRFYLTK
jgi:hypothetical protein